MKFRSQKWTASTKRFSSCFNFHANQTSQICMWISTNELIIINSRPFVVFALSISLSAYFNIEKFVDDEENTRAEQRDLNTIELICSSVCFALKYPEQHNGMWFYGFRLKSPKIIQFFSLLDARRIKNHILSHWAARCVCVCVCVSTIFLNKSKQTFTAAFSVCVLFSALFSSEKSI